jgi:hypothetical protein
MIEVVLANGCVLRIGARISILRCWSASRPRLSNRHDPRSRRRSHMARDRILRYAAWLSGPALLVQETPKRDPQSGHMFVFRGRRGIKIIWPDSQRLSSSRLVRGRFRCSSRAKAS